MPRPLKEVRQERRVGVRRLSQGAPVAPRTIITTEKGESTPSLDTIRKISRFLGVDPVEVSEFREALEKHGLTELPPEEPLSPAPPTYPTGAGEPRDRGRMIEELVRLMRTLGRADVDRAYRLLFEEEPPA